jgi:hypothetical protein
MVLRICPELQSLNRRLTAEEYAGLEANIVADGCHDPLIVWEEEQVLLDGHHRHEICTRHGLPYTTITLSLPSLDAAKLWMLRHQHGRRNLSPNELSYSRGTEYAILKRQGKRTDLTFHQSDGKLPNTAHVLAAQYKVGSATIERDAVYAKAIDTLAEVAGPEVREALLSRETKVTQQDVKALAKIATQFPHMAKQALDAIEEVKTPKQAGQIVRAKARELREHAAYMDAIARSNIPEDEWPASLRPKPTPAPAPVLVLEPEEEEVEEMPVPATQTEALAPECPAPAPTSPAVPDPAPPQASTPRQDFRDLVEALCDAWNGGDSVGLNKGTQTAIA